MTLDEFVAHVRSHHPGAKVVRNGRGYKIACPAHDDPNPSLKADAGDNGGVVLRDYGGCATESVVAALGLSMADLMPNGDAPPRRKRAAAQKPPETAASGFDHEFFYAPTLRKVRIDATANAEKRCWWQHRSGDDGPWTNCAKGACGHERGLYRLSEVREADPARIVYVVESEKTVDLFWKLGAVATTTGGANSWEPHQAALFPAGRDVVALPDCNRNEAGLAYARKVAAALCSKSRSLRVVPLPGLSEMPDGAGPDDWIDAGHEIAELDAIAAAAPTWEPEQQHEPRDEEEREAKAELMPPGRVLRESILRDAPRLPTGFGESFDKKIGGGLIVGLLTIPMGPPGAGKTTVAIQFGRAAHAAGAHVFMLCADEDGNEPSSQKLGQQIGLDDKKLEAGDEEETRRLDEWADGRFTFAPPETTLEEFYDLVHVADTNGAPKVAIVDNLQRVEYEPPPRKGRNGNGAAREQPENQRLAGVVNYSRRRARRIPAQVVLISEFNRGGYASKNPKEWTDDLAAGAGTRAIEYRSDLVLTLREIRDRKASTLRVSRNRPGRGEKPRYVLTHDAVRALYTVEDAPTVLEERDRAADREREKAAQTVAGKIVAAMRKHLHAELEVGRPGISESRLARKARVGRTKQAFKDALGGLEAQGIIEEALQGQSGNFWHWKGGKEPPPEPGDRPRDGASE
jgi:hypothetical protein